MKKQKQRALADLNVPSLFWMKTLTADMKALAREMEMTQLRITPKNRARKLFNRGAARYRLRRLG